VTPQSANRFRTPKEEKSIIIPHNMSINPIKDANISTKSLYFNVNSSFLNNYDLMYLTLWFMTLKRKSSKSYFYYPNINEKATAH
jgi:hypothetical protein